MVPAAAARDVGDLGQTSDNLIVLGLDAGQRAGAAAAYHDVLGIFFRFQERSARHYFRGAMRLMFGCRARRPLAFPLDSLSSSFCARVSRDFRNNLFRRLAVHSFFCAFCMIEMGVRLRLSRLVCFRAVTLPRSQMYFC